MPSCDFNVLIVGGGVHGVGLLHDLASRRVPGVHLVEKSLLSAGSSSRSTKLVHGGIRYLEHLSQWSLVHEALKERGLLLRLLRGLVRPVPFVLPNFKESGRPDWMIRLGLFLYDLLAGDGGLPKSRSITKEDVLRFAPYLKESMVEQDLPSAFLYYDAQMLDDAITRVAAYAACKLGASYQEHTQAISVEPLTDKQGFRVVLETRTSLGASSRQEVTTRFLVNASGAWCNANLLKWGFVPGLTCLLNLGTHMVFQKGVLPQAEPDDCAATLIQAHDKRVVFFIPWFGRWLLGTTESILQGLPDHITPPSHDHDYLMTVAQEVLNLTKPEEQVDEVFCGVRCMPLKMKQQKISELTPEEQSAPFSSRFYVNCLDKSISSLSRETVLDETHKGIISIYGGKYTTYRSTAKKLGLRLSSALGGGGPSLTHSAEAWFLKEIHEKHPEIFDSSPGLRQL